MSGIPPELTDDSLPLSRLPDARWLKDYQDAGCPAGEPIMLSLGETWTGTPPALLDALRAVPDTAHGYQLSMYGLPRLRKALRTYVENTQGPLPPAGWELAVGWSGTRSAMRDFCAHLTERPGHLGRDALVVAPAWDYAGFLEPLGFRPRHVPTQAHEGLAPTVEAIRAAAAAPGLGLVVINAQHNPTGANWTPEVVHALVDAALAQGAALLLDDAYFGLCPEDEKPTSALGILLERLEGRTDKVPWMAVRSLGKQFRCNGWGLGAIVAEPGLLDHFVNEIRPRHTYNYAVHLQQAMADWLEDGPGVRAYLRSQQEDLTAKRHAVLDRLGRHLDPGSLVCGPASPYVLFPLPEEHRDDARAYLARCVSEAGVLLSDAWPLARTGPTPTSGHVRMYLGPSLPVLLEACDRLASAGLLPHASAPAGPRTPAWTS